MVGSGVPTKRWGSQLSFLAGPTGATRFVGSFKDANDNSQVLAITDSGLLTKQSNASYTPITGVSWASGYNIEATQLGGKVYLVNQLREMARYDFTTLTGFATLNTPTGVAAANISGATGTTTWSWRISAISPVGETIASTAISLASLPQTLGTTVKVSWGTVSAASGALSGYNIYRGPIGSEVWVGGVNSTTTQFLDIGEFTTDPTRTAPIADTTGGPKAKYIIRFQDRLILAGIPGAPTKVLISGRYPNNERFDWFGGGGFILVEPDSGEDITGLGTYYRTTDGVQTILVFKENSVWEIVLNTVSVADYAILAPSYRLLTASQGCSSHRSIIAVENDVMFTNRRGVFVLRYEPNLLNVINANEISAKVRPFFENLSYNDITQSSAIYADKKYVLSFPTTKQHIMFDRERLAFMGPWTTPFNVRKWQNYSDAAGTQHWVAASADSPNVYEFNKNLTDDSGTAIATRMRTRKEDFGDWTLYKTLNELFMNFRNVTGTAQVNIYIEERSGRIVAAKSFSVVGTSSLGTSGFGINEFGTNKFGLTSGRSLIVPTELQKKALLYKTARTIQLEIITTAVASNYELLNVKADSIPQSRGNSPTLWNV